MLPKTKNADVAKHFVMFHHVGLLPPGGSGLSFIYPYSADSTLKTWGCKEFLVPNHRSLHPLQTGDLPQQQADFIAVEFCHFSNAMDVADQIDLADPFDLCPLK